MRRLLCPLVGVIVGILIGTGLARAQAPAAASATMQEVWQAAGTLHQSKLQFVATIQRITQAQAGVFGDERPQLEAAIGAMRRALQAWDQGVATFLTATAREKASAELHVARGTVLLDRHRLADALRELDQAERFDPKRPDVPALQALALGALGRPADTLKALERAAARAPLNPALVYGQARRAIEAGQAEEGRRDLARVAEMLSKRAAGADATPQSPFERIGLIRQVPGVAPIFPLARYEPAYAALAANDFPAAVAAFEQAVTTDPLGRSAEPARGAIEQAAKALRGGQWAAARRLAESAVAAAPDDAEARRVLARVLWTDDAPAAGLEQAAAGVRLPAADERVRLLHAELLAAAERPDELRRALEETLRAEPRSGAAHYRLALLHQAEGRLSEARAALDACSRLHPVVGQDHVYFLQGSIAANQADTDASLEAYGRRVDVNPNNPEAHRQIGELYFLQGRDDEALAEHSVAVLLAPGNGRAHAGRGQALLRLQRYAEAAAAFRQAVANGDDRPETRYGLGAALMRQGKGDEGRAEIDASQRLRAAAIAQGQMEFELAARRRAAATEQAAGRHEEAVALFEQALALEPRLARSQQDLGLALLAAGRPGPAAEHLRRALDLEPTVEAAAGLAEALAALGDETGRAAVLARHAQLAAERRRARLSGLTGAP